MTAPVGSGSVERCIFFLTAWDASWQPSVGLRPGPRLRKGPVVLPFWSHFWQRRRWRPGRRPTGRWRKTAKGKVGPSLSFSFQVFQGPLVGLRPGPRSRNGPATLPFWSHFWRRRRGRPGRRPTERWQKTAKGKAGPSSNLLAATAGWPGRRSGACACLAFGGPRGSQGYGPW